MGTISFLFQEVLYRPLFNLLIFLYNIIPGHDFGVAIVLLTVIIKILLIPSYKSAIKSQKALTDLQPKIKEIQEKYKSDREKQGLALMNLYKANKINPFNSFLTLIIQIPILIALYQVFWTGLDPDKLNSLYPFVHNPGIINPSFLGIIDLSRTSPFLAVVAGLSQFIQARMMVPTRAANIVKKDDFMNIMNEQMVYVMPFLTVFFAWKFPAGLALYWTVITLFSIIQQYFVLKPAKDKVSLSPLNLGEANKNERNIQTNNRRTFKGNGI